MTSYIQIHWTCGSVEEARKIAHLLLTKRLVACATLIPAVESHYVWKDKLEMAHETKVIFKTKGEKFEEVKKVILENATYEVPEIVQVDIQKGHAAYLAWIEECVP